MGGQKEKPKGQGQNTLLRHFQRKEEEEEGQQAVQENVEMQVTVGVRPHQSHFDIGNRPIHRAKPHRLPNGKTEFKKILLPEKGKQIQVVHVKGLDVNLPVNPIGSA